MKVFVKKLFPILITVSQVILSPVASNDKEAFAPELFNDLNLKLMIENDKMQVKNMIDRSIYQLRCFLKFCAQPSYLLVSNSKSQPDSFSRLRNRITSKLTDIDSKKLFRF